MSGAPKILPKGAGAVMAAHAPQTVEADSERQALHRRLNYFPTPPWATRALVELLDRLDPEAQYVWEPACGEGHMAYVLREAFNVHATDIHDHGSEHQNGFPLDFLSAEADAVTEADWVVSKPPFSLAAQFVETGLRRARRGVAMLCRLSWFETVERHPLFFGQTPLAVFAPFFERVPMVLGKWDPRASSATAYAWFIWFTPQATPSWLTELRAGGLAQAVTIAIPPGTKARLTRPDDARLFGARGDAPLLEGLE